MPHQLLRNDDDHTLQQVTDIPGRRGLAAHGKGEALLDIQSGAERHLANAVVERGHDDDWLGSGAERT
jgi:hypothetical protein